MENSGSWTSSRPAGSNPHEPEVTDSYTGPNGLGGSLPISPNSAFTWQRSLPNANGPMNDGRQLSTWEAIMDSVYTPAKVSAVTGLPLRRYTKRLSTS